MSATKADTIRELERVPSGTLYAHLTRQPITMYCTVTRTYPTAAPNGSVRGFERRLTTVEVYGTRTFGWHQIQNMDGGRPGSIGPRIDHFSDGCTVAAEILRECGL